jgi:hypothetical protein
MREDYDCTPAHGDVEGSDAPFLVPKLYLGTPLSRQLHCPAISSSLPASTKNKKGEALADLSLFSKRLKDYFFFLVVFLAGAFLAGAFFLAVAIGNHPLFRSHGMREIVQIKIYHCVTIKFFE